MNLATCIRYAEEPKTPTISYIYAPQGVRASDPEQLTVQAGEMADRSYDTDKHFKDESHAERKIWIAALKFREN
ncbi:hypothetical protein RX327_31185 [Bradyrhizobium sp. BEA-2-5]|uniref:hypothetical protein n=1 Tax=Bradyrhizobium sp. BEA-2-5 TaxID=3080015 RepID=UPI00293E1C99|nr:hypothetical protein [Bradyrhizobium sp. BEA-2-5]WOH80244.1 hypothetical protein RX327_31185 [Bradyrhizobium sp. BEA-2-5]